MQHNTHKDNILDRPEIENMKNDFQSLKKNGTSLAKNLSHDGTVLMRDGIDHLKSSGSKGLGRVEDTLRAAPGRTLAAGLITGMVLGYMCKGK